MTLFGPDVSNNNWNSVAQLESFLSQLQGEGFSWIEAKCSEGNYYRDPYWTPTLQWCQANNFPVVPYHYVTTDGAVSQVETFLSNGGGTTVMLDFEANSGDIENFWDVVAAFNAAGVQVVLSYIPHWYWQEIGSPDISTVPGLIASDYVGGSGYASDLYPGDDDTDFWFGYGGATPAILQFTDAAIIAGMSMDCNAFRGTLAELQTLLGAPVTQPPAPTTNPPAIPKPDDQATQISQVWDQLLIRWTDQLNGDTLVEAVGQLLAALPKVAARLSVADPNAGAVNLLSTWTGNGQLSPPEGPNTTTSIFDVLTTLGKIFTQQTPDGLNGFDLLVAIRNAVAPKAP